MSNETNDTRTKILEAAVQVFAQKGYHETRVDDIVAESKTSKGSVYFYFPSKQDIFLGLIDTFSGLLESRLNDAIQKEAHGIQQMESALQVSLSLFSQYRTLAKIVLVQAVGLGTAFEARRREINDRFAKIIQARLERAVLDKSIPPRQAELAARAWVGALNEVVIHWIYTGEPDLESAIPALQIFLLRSIGVANGETQPAADDVSE
ncbi:MAG: TetR/AcrR family transcriptional regulator [Chloroflexi bacterium]|nr:TetR/AcrR family transcriptional regulator [Chloroflexota bacterium]